MAEIPTRCDQRALRACWRATWKQWGGVDGAPRLHRRGHSRSTCRRQPSRIRSMPGADAPVTHDDFLVGVAGHLAYARGTESLHRVASSHARLATRAVPIA
jgi:hypothetical protein